MAVEAGQSGTGTVKTELRENAVGLPGILMQGIATIGPSFAILASFVFIVGFAGLVTRGRSCSAASCSGCRHCRRRSWRRCSRRRAAGTPG